MKRMIGILLAAALSFGVLAMVGCGGDDGPVDTDTTKVVKVWLHKSQAEPEGKVYRALQDLFNEADYKTTDGRDIVMSIEYKNSSDALSTAISGEILSGGLPDVVAVDSPNITSYADGGILIAMDEYLSDEVISDYVDSVIEQSTYNGKLYALSGMDAPGGLYYNKELLKSVGYEDSDFGTVADPWSWKDVEEAMDALKSAGKEYRIKLNLGFGGDEGCMYLYSPLVYSAGGSFIGADNKVSGALTSERSLAGLGMLESLFAQNAEKEWIYNGTNTNALPGGEVAFEIYGPWLIDTIDKSYADFADKYDIMPFPVYEDASGNKGTAASPCGSWGFGVTKDTRDADAAAQVVAFLTGAEASEMFYDSIGTFPTHTSVLENNEDFNSGALKSMADILMETAVARPKMVKYPQLSSAYSDIVEYIETTAGTSDYDLATYVTQKAAAVDR